MQWDSTQQSKSGHKVKPVMWGWTEHDPFMPGPSSYEVANCTAAKQVVVQNKCVATRLLQKEAHIDTERKVFLEKSASSRNNFLANSIFKRRNHGRSSFEDLEPSPSRLIRSRHMLDASTPGKSVSHISNKSSLHHYDNDYIESMQHLTDQAIQLLQENQVEYDLDDPHLRDEHGRVRLDIPDTKEDLNLVFTQERVALPKNISHAFGEGRLHWQGGTNRGHSAILTGVPASKPGVDTRSLNPKLGPRFRLQEIASAFKPKDDKTCAVDVVAKANAIRFPPAPQRGSWTGSLEQQAKSRKEDRQRSSSFQHVKLPHVNKPWAF